MVLIAIKSRKIASRSVFIRINSHILLSKVWKLSVGAKETLDGVDSRTPLGLMNSAMQYNPHVPLTLAILTFSSSSLTNECSWLLFKFSKNLICSWSFVMFLFNFRSSSLISSILLCHSITLAAPVPSLNVLNSSSRFLCFSSSSASCSKTFSRSVRA